MARKLIEKEIVKDFLEAFREHADECKKEDLTVSTRNTALPKFTNV